MVSRTALRGGARQGRTFEFGRQRARARHEERRRQRAAAGLARVCSALTQKVNADVGTDVSADAAVPAD